MATASFFPSRELQTFPLQLERRYDGEGWWIPSPWFYGGCGERSWLIRVAKQR